MIEVVAKLEFITPCLGSLRQRKNQTGVIRMPRDSQGQVIFMQTWWRGVLEYGAKAMTRHQEHVKNIQVDTVVDGPVRRFTRHFRNQGRQGTQIHEAYIAGAVVAVNFMLPSDISVEAFTEILSIGGQYLGISPYGWREDYGRFRVVDVSPRSRAKSSDPDSPTGQPDTGDPES